MLSKRYIKWADSGKATEPGNRTTAH